MAPLFSGDEPAYHPVNFRVNKTRGGYPANDGTAIHDMDGEDEAEPREKPSEVFRRYFGPEHGVELPPRVRYGYRPLELDDEDEP
ncbi:MAG: hypothetical protein OXG62_00270 [Nitrospinae bacterium]|nr:hypothetical protein [Nitrospinota bacterium]